MVKLKSNQDESLNAKGMFSVMSPSDELIAYETIFSQFTIGAVKNRTDSYVLIPKGDQEGLKDLIIVANKSGIRFCFNKGTTKQLVSNIFVAFNMLRIGNCKSLSKSKFIIIDYMAISPEIQTKIISKLTNNHKIKLQ
jgi:hypothetical protein